MKDYSPLAKEQGQDFQRCQKIETREAEMAWVERKERAEG